VLSVWATSGQAADSWGLQNETVTEIEARVVDVACVLKQDCPPNCGAGKRQLGLLTADGKLRLAAKGGTTFAGAVQELLPHCGKVVFADGLLIAAPELTIFMVQNLRLSKDEKLVPATAFEKEWAVKNGKAEEWYRADPRVKSIIAEDGVLGVKGLTPEKK
jgi:hypothetical protein